MAEVDILLAAYNGEKYIAEQIASLLAQTFQDFRIIIRDDGSTDNTPAIIEEYAAKYPDKIKVVHDNAVCRNATSNFFQLLKYAEADYVMFCDQDDLWLPYKVQISIDYMKKTEQDAPRKPVMVFTGLEVTGSRLERTDKFMALGVSKRCYEFESLLMGNCASGCTEMMNRPLWSRLGSYDDCIDLHDHWAALYASVSGVIRHIPMALILYRQHGSNVIGAKTEGMALRIAKFVRDVTLRTITKWKSSRETFKRLYKKFMLLRERIPEDTAPDRLKALDDCIVMFSPNSSAGAKFAAMRRLRFMQHHGLFEYLKMVVRLIML